MKVLLWMLLLFILTRADEDSSEQEFEEVRGGLNTIYLACNNKTKISDNGPLRFYMRNIKKSPQSIRFSFYLRVNNTCQPFSLKGDMNEDTWVTLWYSGKNYLRALPRYNNASVFFLANISEEGFVSSVMMALSPQDYLTPEEYEYFKEETKKMVIPVKNILKIAGTDTCPPDEN